MGTGMYSSDDLLCINGDCWYTNSYQGLIVKDTCTMGLSGLRNYTMSDEQKMGQRNSLSSTETTDQADGKSITFTTQNDNEVTIKVDPEESVSGNVLLYVNKELHGEYKYDSIKNIGTLCIEETVHGKQVESTCMINLSTGDYDYACSDDSYGDIYVTTYLEFLCVVVSAYLGLKYGVIFSVGGIILLAIVQHIYNKVQTYKKYKKELDHMYMELGVASMEGDTEKEDEVFEKILLFEKLHSI